MHLTLRGLIFFSFLLFCATTSLVAQNRVVGLSPDKVITQYNHDYWDLDKGMPSNTVLDNRLSSEGYMWIATFDGLVKFDGVNFQIFNEKNHPAFKKNGVLSLFEDDDNLLWIGSNGGGLIKMENNNFVLFQDDTLQQSNIIADIDQDREGFLWLATRNGVSKFKDGDFIRDPQLESLSSSAILSLMIDNEGGIWIGTLGEGLYLLSEGRLEHFDTGSGLDNNSVRSLLEDSQGNIWIGTNIGINRYRDGAISTLEIPGISSGFFVNDIIEDVYGALWFASDIGLIKSYREKIEILDQTNGLIDNNVQSLAFDNEGSLWMGNYRRGISRIKDGKFKNFGVLEGLSNEVINIAYQEGDRIWIGTDNGLAKFENEKITSFSLGSGYQKNRVRDVLRDRQGNLWICTYDGLVLFDDGVVKKRYFQKDGLTNNKLRVMAEDTEGNIWIGTSKGLNKFRDGDFVQYGRKDGLQNEFIMSIFEDSQQRLWIGTDGGGIHLWENGRFKNYSEQEGLASNVVFQISEHANGDLWIGTNGGVTRYDGTSFKSITFRNGLYSNSVFQIIIDSDDDFWLMTNKGIQQTNHQMLQAVLDGEIAQIKEAVTYDHSEGMRSSVVTGASIGDLGKNGEILVPTFKGLTIINPEEIRINNFKPPVLITDVLLNNQQRPFLEDITLPAGSESLEIHYTGLSLYASDEVRFHYKLEGFDEDWVDAANRRVAYYTNLPPGSYIFRVKAANNDGVWNEEGTNITLTKEAFFYQTKWFPVMILLFVFLAGFLTYYLRARQLKNKNKELMELVEIHTRDIHKQNQEITEQKEELKQLNAIKDKLFSIISHDLRGPINSFSGILGLLSTGSITKEETAMLSKNLEGDLNRLKSLLDNLLNWAKTQMQGIKSNQVPIALSEVVKENMELLGLDAHKKQIDLINKVAVNTKVMADLDMTKLVFRNLIGNAIKFTPNTGDVIVQAQQVEENFVEIWVIDNGVGIPDDIAKKLFSNDYHYSKLGTSKEDGFGLGLLLCREFIEENGGKIWVESEEGKGSIFKFRLKNAADQFGQN
ncbi:two-component regulator propeller domain-containing protein [Fulvivirgaceae bacterium BMA12]|uniref:histidine kinase n=1 Tax=Agaribacillus aureus TaxID=3051825 RepID=A0ABT8L8N5_9BACT|nr:two-component regulator propeller domain-containing protein [Fulvivirgaceae bacterium BMA12]